MAIDIRSLVSGLLGREKITDEAIDEAPPPGDAPIRTRSFNESVCISELSASGIFSEEEVRTKCRRQAVSATRKSPNSKCQQIVDGINQRRKIDSNQATQERLGEAESVGCQFIEQTAGSNPSLGLVVNPTRVPNPLENALNDYINVQYHIVWSMVSEPETRRIQRRLGRNLAQSGETLDELRREVRNSGNITIASTGENFTNEGAAVVPTTIEVNAPVSFDPENFAAQTISSLRSKQISEDLDSARPDGCRNYYHIQNFSMSNFMSPSPQNENVASYFGLSMKVIEPHGFKLVEDLKRISRTSGYRNINPGRIVYKIDLYWSGYNPRTGEWVERIPLGVGDEVNKPAITYYVSITKFNANVTHQGTEYDIDFGPTGHFALRPEECTLKGTVIWAQDGNTFGEFLKSLSSIMNKKKQDDTKEALGSTRPYKRIYRFYAPDVLKKMNFNVEDYFTEKGYVGENASGGYTVTVGDGIDILTLLKDVLADLPPVQNLFLNRDDDDFIEPVTQFTVRVNTRYDIDGGEEEINDYKKIIYEYIIEPFQSFKKGNIRPDNASRYVSASSQRRRIEEIVSRGSLVRIYDYLNTAENTEVMDLEIKLNPFYYESFTRNMDPPAGKGIRVNSAPGDIVDKETTRTLRRDIDANLQDGPNSFLAVRFQTQTDSIMQRLFGEGVDSGVGGGSCDNTETGPFDVLWGGFNVTNDVLSPSSSSSETGDGGQKGERKDEYKRRINDYLRNDFLKLDPLEVRGDPVWLFSPYGSESLNTLSPINAAPITSEDSSDDPIQVEEGIIQPAMDRILFVNMRQPRQFDYMDPNRTQSTSDPTIIGGFYQVTRVESFFDGGKFTQKIYGIKLNHLNYAEERYPTKGNSPTPEQLSVNPNAEITRGGA